METIFVKSHTNLHFVSFAEQPAFTPQPVAKEKRYLYFNFPCCKKEWQEKQPTYLQTLGGALTELSVVEVGGAAVAGQRPE